MAVKGGRRIRSVAGEIRYGSPPPRTSGKSPFVGALRACDRFFCRVADTLLHTGFCRTLGVLAGVVGFAVVVGTAWQLWEEAVDRREDRIERDADRRMRVEERRERALTRLLQSAPGDTAKTEALRILQEEGASLRGLDLSCKAIGGWNAALGVCEKPAKFGSLEFRSDVQLDFSGNSLGTVDVVGPANVVLYLQDTQLRAINIRDTNIDLRGEAQIMLGCQVINSKARLLTQAYDKCDISGTSFSTEQIDLLGSKLEMDMLPILDAIQTGRLTLLASADNPPRHEAGDSWSDEELAQISLCDPAERMFCRSLSAHEAKSRFPEAYMSPMARAFRKRHPDAYVVAPNELGTQMRQSTD